MRQFDVIVIGGGHAGCEAAGAAARMGATVALVTPDLATIGAMSCNPAIGGVGKGHLVREVDVFDGLMARAADHAAIHYRMLNRSKGAAVQGPRVQADRSRYRRAVRTLLDGHAGLTLIYDRVERLVLTAGQVSGLVLAGGCLLRCAAVVLATGTFLAGRLHHGGEQRHGGRWGEPATATLAAQLHGLGLPMGRLKTGTPPRLDGRTIDWAALDRQPSDRERWSFSPLGGGRVAPQLACALTRTNRRTHDLIRAGLSQSPLHSGAITGAGPRYCPSIEDKVCRFGDREGHQVFLEPEGLDTFLVYPNGISTSLPLSVQESLVNSIAGLERARIVRLGYAVEYDFLDPRALDTRLALRDVPNLYCAGQINGTTGYEEAAAQGLVAGLNAGAAALGRSAILFDRTQSYIGVMVDDLTLQGVTEPYRMLTARAEYRLRLRADNAASRLGSLARASGAIGTKRRAWLDAHDRLLEQVGAALAQPGWSIGADGRMRSLADEARRGPINPAMILARLPELAAARDVIPQALEDARYAPYLARQDAETARVGAEASLGLDAIGSFAALPGLSNEMVERLEAARPANLAAAGRIRGITPAALATLMVAARRRGVSA